MRHGCGSHAAVSEDSKSAEPLRQILATHEPSGEREVRSMEIFIRELSRLARPCDEDADTVHVTASAVVVGTRGTILHRHRRLGRWMQPGGHIEPGESPWEAALRETREETGLEGSHPAEGPCLVHVDAHPAAKGHFHLDLRYLVLASDADPAPGPGESPDVKWCSWEEANAMADESLQGALWQARLLRGATRQPTDSTDDSTGELAGDRHG